MDGPFFYLILMAKLNMVKYVTWARIDYFIISTAYQWNFHNPGFC